MQTGSSVMVFCWLMVNSKKEYRECVLQTVDSSEVVAVRSIEKTKERVEFL